MNNNPRIQQLVKHITPKDVGEEVLKCFDYVGFLENGKQRIACWNWAIDTAGIVIGNGEKLSQAKKLFLLDGAQTRLISATQFGPDTRPSYKLIIGVTPQLKLRTAGNSVLDNVTQIGKADQLARSFDLSLKSQPPMGSIVKEGLPAWLVLPEITMTMVVYRF